MNCLPSKPLLAATITDISALRYPVLASPKLDGIRCLIGPDGPVSRTFKPIPNRFIREMLNREWLRSFDGEIMLRDTGASFRDVTSAVMRESGEPDFVFHVFDCGSDMKTPFAERKAFVRLRVSKLHDECLEWGRYVTSVDQVYLFSAEELSEYETRILSAGYEGVMVRDPNGVYKAGRSTVRDGILGKIKRFTDDEAECIGVVEMFHNDNAATVNALGHTERSTHKAGKRPAGVMGALVVRDKRGREFEIGTGFSAADRAAMWIDKPIGKLVKYKAMDFSDYDKPRHPVFLGFRDPIDC